MTISWRAGAVSCGPRGIAPPASFPDCWRSRACKRQAVQVANASRVAALDVTTDRDPHSVLLGILRSIQPE